MPPAVAVAGITAAGTLGGALMQNSANKRATKAQADANTASLAWEKEKAAKADTYRQQSMDDYNRRYAAWEAGRNALLSKKYGVDLSGATSGGSGGSGFTPVGDLGAQRQIPGRTAPTTLGDLASSGFGAPAEQGQPTDAGDGSDWNDWSKYGVR